MTSGEGRRVLLVTNIFPPQIGGPATFIDKLARLLAEREWRVSVVCCSDRRRDPTDGARPFRVVRIAAPNLVAQQALIPPVLLRECIRHERILVNGLEYQSFLAARLARRKYLLKIVGDSAWERARNLGLTSMSIDEFQQHHARFPAVQGIIARRRAVMTRARLVVTPSDYLRSVVIGWGADAARVRTIRNAVPEPAAPIPRRTSPQGSLRVCFIGRMTNWKGVETILLAVERTANVHLTVVGDGPELPMLEGLARQLALGGRVEFTGRQSNENARRIMGASDALVLLSQYEGLSHTLLEAASAGVPCIASSAGGNPEAVRDGETGLLIPYGDVRALQNAMEVLRDDAGLRERLGAAAAAFGRTFSFDATAAEYAGHLAAADGAG